MRKGRGSTIPLGNARAILWVVLFSALITSVMGDLSLADARTLTRVAGRSLWLVPLLNWLPVALFMLLALFLTGSAGFAASAVGAAMVGMAVVNRVKIDLRGDPLMHWDLSMAHEVLGIARGYGWLAIALAALLALALVGFVVAACVYVRTERMPWRLRLLGALCCVAAMLIANATLYSSRRLHAWLPVEGTEYNQADVHNSRGNLYAFLYSWNAYRATAPDGYDPEATRAFIAGIDTPPAETSARPNILLIMGEAFSDISESDALRFDGHRDPLAGYKALAAEGISGHIVVPGRGGGTADTEADVLTALPARYLRIAPYTYRLINRTTEALPSLLATLGYESFALHPGYPWFYNRQNVYANLGFGRSLFMDAFAPEDYEGFYISEEATFTRLIEQIDAHLTAAPDTPLMALCVTIQNHGPYQGRYFDEGGINFGTDAALTAGEANALANYLAGLIDADEQLLRLAGWLQSIDEPFVVLYFGDHLPALDERLYDLLIPGADAPEGSLARETRLYTTPFLIWQNDAARAITGIGAQAGGITISSNYLGAYLLRLLGMEGLSPLMTYSAALMDEYPVLMEKIAYDAQGMPAGGEAGQALRHWAYFETAGQ